MKTILFTILILIPFCSFSQYEKETEELNVSIEWNGRHCNGSVGLCDITINNSSKTLGNNKIIYNNDNETIVIIINKDSLSNDDALKILGKKSNTISTQEQLYYNLTYDFKLYSSLITDLKLEHGLNTISKGNYPITITEDTIIITFNLK